MVDTGFDYFHPDLAQNLWSNPGEIPNNGKDDDNNGVLLHNAFSMAWKITTLDGQGTEVQLVLLCQVLWTMCMASTSSRGRRVVTRMMTTGMAPLLLAWLALSVTMRWVSQASLRLPAS